MSHGLGALFAALLLPLIVGASLVDPGNGSLHDWYKATASAVVQAYLDLAWRGRSLTQQYGHFVLILGAPRWGTGQFAGYAAFGHKRPMTAVITLGLALLLNMAITIQDQLPYLVIFSLAALLYLIRVNAVREQGAWLRRRIGDPRDVGALYIRGGVAFVTIAVVGSLFLTASASSAPLAGAWTGMQQTFINFGTQLQRYLPGGGPGTRITGRLRSVPTRRSRAAGSRTRRPPSRSRCRRTTSTSTTGAPSRTTTSTTRAGAWTPRSRRRIVPARPTFWALRPRATTSRRSCARSPSPIQPLAFRGIDGAQPAAARPRSTRAVEDHAHRR